MTEYMTIPKLAQKVGVSDNTVRRYTRNFRQFFRLKRFERHDKYPVEESVKLIRAINEFSRAGQPIEDVVAKLLEAGFTPAEQEQEPDRENEGQSEMMPGALRELGRIADALEKIAGKMTS